MKKTTKISSHSGTNQNRKTGKRLMSFLFSMAIMLCVMMGFGQSAPQAVPYQAVARNNSGNLIASQNISLRFSIHDGTAAGTVVYEETQSITTNTLGLFTLNIGQGTPVAGTFSAINWGSGSKFTQVEMDVTGGTSYIDMGTSQMLSVPYAMYALTSGNGAGPVGATGATGIAGTNGTNGIDGATGATGTAGTNGTNGIDGATGPTGANGQGGVTIAGNKITVTGAGTVGSPYVVNYSPAKYDLGYHSELGGYVFYITSDSTHGLVIETQNQYDTWINAQSAISNVNANHNADSKKFTDWRLPNKYEYGLIYSQKSAIGISFSSQAWCSEIYDNFSSNAAYCINLGNGSISYYYVLNDLIIYAVRSF